MLQARAIIYAIIVALFVALISAAFIQLAEMNRTLQTDQIVQEKLIRNLNSGKTLLLNTEGGDDVSQTIDLYGKQEDSLVITKRVWGFFAIGSVTAFSRNTFTSDTLQKIYLLGSPNNVTLPAALYVSDFNSPLSLTGNTLIVGNAYLPKSGITTVSIAGMNYARPELIYGNRASSTSMLPELDNNIYNKLYNQNAEKTITIKTIPKKIEQSFNLPTLTVQADSMYLDNCELKGNIHIKSEGSITIGPNCHIEDVLITASKILIKSGFQGSVQAYAQNECVLEQNTTLLYPSVIGIVRTYKATTPAVLIMNRGSVIDGALIAFQEQSNSQPIWASLQEGSIVRGQVYIRGALELKGSVYGNVTTDKFILRAGGGLYSNIIMNGVIDRTKLSHFYIGPLVIKSKEKVGIVKFLK